MGVRTDLDPRLPIFSGVSKAFSGRTWRFSSPGIVSSWLSSICLAHPTVLPNQEAFFWLGIALAGLLSLYVPTMEWHQETDRMLSSLPVRRATMVFSRYLSSIVACGFAAIAWISTGRLLAPS